MAGQDLSDADQAWLLSGGPFPQELVFRLPSGSGSMHLQVVDRDSSGLVAGIKTGKKGFVLRVRDPSTNVTYAAKLCAPGDYDETRTPALEAKRSQLLAIAGALFVTVQHVGTVDALAGQPDTSHGWVVFLMRWVDGRTLKEFLRESSEAVVPTLAVTILKELIQSVLILEESGLRHDDLHAGNIMIETVPAGVLVGRRDVPPQRLVVLDTGSLKLAQQGSKKELDDRGRWVTVASDLHNAIHLNRGVASRHATFQHQFREFIHQLADDDVTRHFPTNEQLFGALDELQKLAEYPGPPAHRKFQPFDGISAEHLASDSLLLELFVDGLSWIRAVLDEPPAVVYGPRGCGKSMVFRYMAARTHVSSATASANFLTTIRFLGIYVPCASDLQNDLLWIAREQGRPERLAAEITTFFNLVLARELFRTLALVQGCRATREALQIAESGMRSLTEFCRTFLPARPPDLRLRADGLAEALASELDRHRVDLSQCLLHERPVPFKLPSTFLRDLCRQASKDIPGLATYKTVFLLDDFSIPRIPESIQLVLNQVLWLRDKAIAFKISCERWGFHATELDKTRLDVDREFVQVDAGRLTVEARPKQKRIFVSKLLDQRLATAGYSANIKQLLGSSTYRPDKALAKKIRDAAQSKGRVALYEGIHVLTNLFSGDVATVIHFARSIFIKANVGPSTTATVAPHVQHEAILEVSKALVERIRSFYPWGPEMHAICTKFGFLVRWLLTEGSLTTDGTPRRLIRLEMTKDSPYDIYERLGKLNPDVEKVARELVRRSVFIDLAPSRGKEGADKETVRWQMRSALLPNFAVALRRESYIDMKTPENLVRLLTVTDALFNEIKAGYQTKAPMDDLFAEKTP